MNKSLLRSLTLFLFPIILFVGCAKPPAKPKPEDTVMRGSSKRADYVSSKHKSGDHIDETLVYSDKSYEEPLMPRSTQQGRDGINASQNLMDSVYFGFDRSNIDAQERTKLLRVAEHLNANTHNNVLIKGYCDYFGTKEYNLALGERRALSAKRYLEQLGIPSSRIETVSMGNLEAQYKGSKEEVAKDRRDDIFILN